MKNLFSALAGAAVLAALSFATPAAAADKGELLRDANITVNHLKTDPAFATAARMMRDARAVYIVPHLVKGGFIFGAEGGAGVLLHKTATGWSDPKFYDMASASFGFQAGLEKAELVFIINSQSALDGIEKGNFKFGAQAGVTVVTLSAGAEGATTSRGGDIVVWTSATGVFGGAALNGTAISPDKDWNASANPAGPTQALRNNLASVR